MEPGGLGGDGTARRTHLSLYNPRRRSSASGLTAASAPTPTCAEPSGRAPLACPKRKGTLPPRERRHLWAVPKAGGTALFATAPAGHSSAPFPGQVLTKGLSGPITPKGGDEPGSLAGGAGRAPLSEQKEGEATAGRHLSFEILL